VFVTAVLKVTQLMDINYFLNMVISGVTSPNETQAAAQLKITHLL